MVAALKRPTLVLNRNWQPVNISTVDRALIMVWNDSARVVDPDNYALYDWDSWVCTEPEEGEDLIKTPTFDIRVPEIITLLNYKDLPSSKVTFSRRNVFKRDKYTCQFCGKQPLQDELTIDHVLPKSQGGQSSWENCVLACIDCNKTKADRTPEQAGMRLKKKPKRPDWRPIYSQEVSSMQSWSNFISDAYWNIELEK